MTGEQNDVKNQKPRLAGSVKDTMGIEPQPVNSLRRNESQGSTGFKGRYRRFLADSNHDYLTCFGSVLTPAYAI